MEEDMLLLLLLLEEEQNLENRDRALYFRSLRDSSDPFALSESEFMKNFRLPRDICRSLIEDLRPHDQQKTSLPLTIRVLATLNFFGHGSYQKCVGNNCNLPMSQSSLSRSMRAVAKLIVKVKGGEIKFPSSTEEENIVRTGFFTKYGIKCTIGAIDCTHVAIIAPASNNAERPLSLYLNRKGFYSINVEAPDQIPQDEQVLVCKYVLDPLCIDGHKCDLRVYVLVTSFDPLIIYIYEEGLVRLATVKYERGAENLWNPCMHLCNYSINKYHSDYIKSLDAEVEDVGHKWTLSALLRHLKQQGCNTRQLMASIEDLVVKSIFACAQTIISACRMFVPSGNNCFELYGFDILIDDSLKPWLLEVNLSPSMGVDSPLDSKVKTCLITDLLTCVGIPAYSTDMRAQYDKKWTRFRNVNSARRMALVDSNVSTCSTGGRRFISSSTPIQKTLTMEEQRILRNARLQNDRRGGFVRIFPTDDSMQRYGNFLEISTGIPISTPIVQGQMSYSMTLPHNYNQVLFNYLYGPENGKKEFNSLKERMCQYERVLSVGSLDLFSGACLKSKCVEEGKRLRKHIVKLIISGSELTQLQARQAFALYLETILHRLTQEPRDFHEKIILKFLNRVGSVKTPVFFRNPQNVRGNSKARSAMVAKLLGDFLEQYNRDTEAYVDAFDHFGMIPSSLFVNFLSQAQESDLEAILALHTNVTGNMSYLYNRFGLSVPQTPPIPSGSHGFLKALPSMVLTGSVAREFNKCDGYYKTHEKNVIGFKSEKTFEGVIKKIK